MCQLDPIDPNDISEPRYSELFKISIMGSSPDSYTTIHPIRKPTILLSRHIINRILSATQYKATTTEMTLPYEAKQHSTCHRESTFSQNIPTRTTRFHEPTEE
ncbi:hypothetical protein E4U13_002922 [Claviceps humidiphila]|uniref:Uncharacterized protein n=1 Tax=Claviceps humidiphila TaxID=1294629 RepID=A0A9P7Q0F3_9HYPO|nr:hypothetical protein E4U13_002922 [Claviceps humidiphila]